MKSSITRRLSGHGVTVVASALALASSGCAMLGSVMVGLGIENPTANIARQEPAEHDFAGTNTIAVAPLSGKPEDALELAGEISGQLGESGRFMIVERDRLERIATERGCDIADAGCLSADLPASAVIFGSVTQSRYAETVDSSTSDCTVDGKKRKCTYRTRKGVGHFGASLRLVDTTNGKVLFQRVVKKQASARTRSDEGGAPEGIDGASLVASARGMAAFEFARAISPHSVIETIELEADGDIKGLDEAIDLTQRGEHDDALRGYQDALERAEQDPELDPEEVAKAHYNVGVGAFAVGDYARALSSLDAALKVDDDEDWRELRRKLTHWKTDAERVEQQLALRDAQSAEAEPAPAIDTAEAPATDVSPHAAL